MQLSPKYNETQLQSEVRRFLRKNSYKYFITLTFKNTNITEQSAINSLRVFMRILERFVYGKRCVSKEHQKLNFLPILERNSYKGYHWHILISPLSSISKIDEHLFLDTILSLWVKTIRTAGERSKVEIIRNKKRAIEYITKLVRLNTDVICWQIMPID